MTKRKFLRYLTAAAVLGFCSATFAQIIIENEAKEAAPQENSPTVLTINYSNPDDPNSYYWIRILPADKGPLCYPAGKTGAKVLQGTPLILTKTDLQSCGGLPYWIQSSKGIAYGKTPTQITNYGTCYIDKKGQITCQ